MTYWQTVNLKLTYRQDGEKGQINMGKINAEWITWMKAYRLYTPQNPYRTVAWEDDIEIAERHAIENGYDGLVLCDSDTMHIEV